MLHIGRRVFDNGLTLLVNENSRLPICTLMIWFRVGSRHEGPGITGMSHFLEHCYSMGTARFGPRENSWIIQRLGGTKNAFTSRDYTAYYSNIPSDHLDLVMDMEADRLANLTLPEPNVLSEKEVIKEEKRLRYEDSPFGKMYETLYEMAYDAHPYQHPVIGRWDDLNAMTRDDMWNYYRRMYTPSRVVVAIAGAVPFAKAEELVQRHFGSLDSAGEISQSTVPDVQEVRGRRLVIRKESELPALLIGWPGVAIDHEDYVALTAAAAVLANGRSSRLYRCLVFDLHLATFVSASFDAAAGPGLFQIMSQAQPGRSIEEVEGAVEEQLGLLRNEAILSDELDSIRNQMEAGFVYALESNEHRAEIMGRFEVLSARHGAEFVNEFLPMMRKLTPDDIRRVSAKYLVPDRRTTVILDPIRRH